MISGFRGSYFFLSNFYDAPMNINGKEYETVEHYFQSQKTFNEEESESIRLASTPNEAKKYGRECNLRKDWNSVRIEVMKTALSAKFNQHPELRQKLINTGNKELIEFNNWGDTFWGVTGHGGENKLGTLLMELRNKYMKE